MTGWVSFFAGFSAPIAAAALAFADYLGYFFPSLKQANASLVVGSGALSLRLGHGQLVASALIGAFTILNCFGVGRTAKVQNVLTGTKLVVIASFVLLGFIAGSGSWEHFSLPVVRTSTVSLPVQFMISLLWVMVGYSGWNAATYIAEEVKRPERTLPMALAVGTTLVTALYVGLNLIFIYASPLETMKGVLAIGSVSVASLFVFRRGQRWQKLRPVSFWFPLIPGAYILVGAGMITYGLLWQPKASLTALATIAVGAAVYHFGPAKALARET